MNTLPVTQQQGIIFGAIIIALIILINIVNAIAIYNKINRNDKKLMDQLGDVSKQLLVQSGYLKEKDNV